MNQTVNKFVNELLAYNIKYAVITGAYEVEGCLVEKEERNFVEDLDIVFFDITCEELQRIFEDIGVEHYIHNTYKYKLNLNELPIDIYIDYINVGYYYLFKINKEDLINKNGRIIINENDYIIYQFLEPLVKFSEYRIRHKYRLKKYINNEYITDSFKKRLYGVIGRYCTEYILNALIENKLISENFIKLLKIRLLFINNNFYRIFQKRMLKNDQCLY